MKYYIVLDLEWTSWSKNYYGRFLRKEKRKIWQKKEIIQIGAIKFDKNFKIKKKINIYVKPVINRKLSKYITKLTSITDEILKKKGIKFIDAFKKLIKFSKKNFLFSNGADGNVIKKNFLYNKIKMKPIKIFNVKKILKKKYNIPEKYLHSPMLKTYFGYKYINKRAHNALYDCQSVILAMKKMNFDLKIFDNMRHM
jgi:DNA polymerase III epsilon subunit-like protein